MQISPNNKYSNHFRKKKTTKIEFTFIEDYDYQIFKHPNNPFKLPSTDNFSTNNQYNLIFSDYNNISTINSDYPDNPITNIFGGDVKSLGNVGILAITDSINDNHEDTNRLCFVIW